MKTAKLPFILFFVKGVKPTAEEIAAASKIRGRIGMRNASVIRPEDAPEPCDGVAGAVPKSYAKLPTAAAAIAAFDAKLEAAAKLVGDKPAPKPKTPAQPVKTGDDGKPTNLPGGDGKPPAWPGAKK